MLTLVLSLGLHNGQALELRKITLFNMKKLPHSGFKQKHNDHSLVIEYY
jgi:hypothetical protein